MTPKEYLNQTYRLNELINSNLRQLENLHTLLYSLSSPTDSKVDKSPSSTAPFARTIEKIFDLENDINAQIDRLVMVQNEVRQAIATVKDKDERLLLQLRYLEHCSWEEITVKMKFSAAQCHRIHQKALKNIKIPKVERKRE